MPAPSLTRLTAQIAALKARLADPSLPDKHRAVLNEDLRMAVRQMVGRKIAVNGITKGNYDGT